MKINRIQLERRDGIEIAEAELVWTPAHRLDRGDERTRLEWLVQISCAAGYHRRRPTVFAVVAGDEDDGHRNAHGRKLTAQIDAGMACQIDVQDYAKRLIEILMLEQRSGRVE